MVEWIQLLPHSVCIQQFSHRIDVNLAHTNTLAGTLIRIHTQFTKENVSSLSPIFPHVYGWQQAEEFVDRYEIFPPSQFGVMLECVSVCVCVYATCMGMRYAYVYTFSLVELMLPTTVIAWLLKSFLGLFSIPAQSSRAAHIFSSR